MPRPRESVSLKRLAANRANPARSTGPRTPQGKARSAQNALTHGFAASTVDVVRLETGDFLLGGGSRRKAIQSNSWSLAKRYRAQADRHYRCTVEEFDRLQALRPKPVNSENKPSLDSQPNHNKRLNHFPVGQTPPSADAPMAGLKALRPKSAKSENKAILDSQQHQHKSLNPVTGSAANPELMSTPVLQQLQFFASRQESPAPLWGGLLTRGRLAVGPQRRLPTAARDSILPHGLPQGHSEVCCDAGQTPPSAAGPPAGLSSPSPASGSSLPEHPVRQAVPPVHHQLLSNRCTREEPVRTPR